MTKMIVVNKAFSETSKACAKYDSQIAQELTKQSNDKIDVINEQFRIL